MRGIINFVVVVLVFSSQNSDAAIDAATKKIITVLQNQLTQPILVDYFKRGGSLDPAISTILQYVPSADIASFTCFLTNINGAIEIGRANTGNLLNVLAYFKDTCNGDANLNKAMEVLSDPTAQNRLRGLSTTMTSTLPAQIQKIALALMDQAFSGKNITVAEANAYIAQVKNLNPTTKQFLFKKVPSLKKVLNKKGPMFKPYNTLLTNLPILISNKAPTATQKKNINAALKKIWKYGKNNAVEFIRAALNWLKALPIADSANDPTVLQNYKNGATKMIQSAKVALMLPMTQEMIEKYSNTPYQLP